MLLFNIYLKYDIIIYYIDEKNISHGKIGLPLTKQFNQNQIQLR